MKKLLLSIAIFGMALCANAQTNQYFWYQGNLMLGTQIAQVDSVTFGDNESVDTLHLLLPRTIIKEVHDTTYITKYVPITKGSLAGEFSVSASKKVRFAKGNLQYQPSTEKWRFAEHQFDTIGAANANIGSAYTGWLDLFGWGTGNNPLQTSTSYNDYSSFVDWGVNAISNGGNEANIWRTLTKDEWAYLFITRPNAATRFALGSVAGINGVILLPDEWTTPANVSVVFSTAKGLEYKEGYYENKTGSSYGNNFADNTYSVEQWTILESAGAVFLPAAGRRYNTEVTDVNSRGDYFSSTPAEEARNMYALYYQSGSLHPTQEIYRCNGRAVRLVQEVE